MDHPWAASAVGAAYDAGTAILRLYGCAGAVERKGDDSPLTAADRAAHDVIVRGLAASPAGVPILSEESRETPYAERCRWGRFWLVDPLDGTKEFLKRNGEFTVNIALVEGGVPVFGVVWAPVLGSVYVGGLGLGAFAAVKGAQFQGREDLVAGAADPRRAGWEPLPRAGASPSAAGRVRVVASRSHESEATRAFVEALAAEHGAVELLSIGSSLKLCLVAEGRADVYPRLAPTMEWDTAAAQAVVEAAGGSVREHPCGRPLRYNKPDLHNPFFVAVRAGWPAPVPPS